MFFYWIFLCVETFNPDHLAQSHNLLHQHNQSSDKVQHRNSRKSKGGTGNFLEFFLVSDPIYFTSNYILGVTKE